jgi:hypothetical protein
MSYFSTLIFTQKSRLTNMDEMQKIGLYLNDLNKFDGSAEMLGKKISLS